ncbi:MAG: prepilin-type N-terminal cleavage/methylation domain-containing protein [Verrucomicrobiae bacterium]|nr:prepilin-type N-terminal cleavage/methylation domain-containing protein [Verrucomicrobiae bacterium]
MQVTPGTMRSWARGAGGFTLAEVIIAIALSAMVLASLITGYISTARRAEWTAMSEAAQLKVVNRMEQVRAARWDPLAVPPVDMLVASNFPVLVEELFTPLGGTNATLATNVVNIMQVSTKPPVKLVRVECCWRFLNNRLYTNSLMLYRYPDP